MEPKEECTQNFNFTLDDFNDSKEDEYISKKKNNEFEEFQKQIKEDNASLLILPLLDLIRRNRSLSQKQKTEFNDYINKGASYPDSLWEADLCPISVTDLANLINKSIAVFGPECNLNWINVTGVTNFRGLFLHSSFKGKISSWKIADGADCSYMFAFSEFDKRENLPKCLRDEFNPSNNIDTTGIFCGCKIEQDN